MYIKYNFFHSKKVERSHGLNFIDSLHTLLIGLNHELSKENLRKLELKCKLLQLFWLKLMYFSSVAVMITTIAIILLIIYMRQDYDYYFVILVFLLLTSYIRLPG
jgi:hypothetical protein